MDIKSAPTSYDNVKVNTPIDNPNVTQSIPGNKWEENENIKGTGANVALEKKIDTRDKQTIDHQEILHDANSMTPNEKALNEIIRNHSGDII